MSAGVQCEGIVDKHYKREQDNRDRGGDRERKDNATDLVLKGGGLLQERDDRLHLAQESGGRERGQKSQRGNGSQARRGGRLQYPLRGLHQQKHSHQVHDRRSLAQGKSQRQRSRVYKYIIYIYI